MFRLLESNDSILSPDEMLTVLARAAQIVPIIWKHGLFYSICADDAWTPRMETYYIFNYFVRSRRPILQAALAELTSR